MIALNYSVLVYKDYHVEAPKETPGNGVHSDIVHTIVNTRYHLIYVWLYNKKEYWFFPIYDDGIFLDGYGWNGYNWIKTKIRMASIKSYCC